MATKYLDYAGLTYYSKRTHVQSAGGTVTVSSAANENFSTVNTEYNLEVNIPSLIDGSTIVTDRLDLMKCALTIHQLTAQELSSASLGANVREAYILRDADNTRVGDYIKIYNSESSLDQVYIGHTDDSLSSTPDPTTGKPYTITSGTGDDALCFVYKLQDGTYQLTCVSIEEYFNEQEVGNGLQTNSHVISVKNGVGLDFGSTNHELKIDLHDKYKDGTGSSYTNRSFLTLSSPNSQTGADGGLAVDLSHLHETFRVDTRSSYSDNYITLHIDPNVADEAFPVLDPGTVGITRLLVGAKANLVSDITAAGETPSGSSTANADGLINGYNLKQYLRGDGKVSVAHGTDTNYVTLSIQTSTRSTERDSWKTGETYTLSVQNTIQSVSSATSQNNGLATAYDVQGYVGSYISTNIISITNTEIDALFVTNNT